MTTVSIPEGLRHLLLVALTGASRSRSTAVRGRHRPGRHPRLAFDLRVPGPRGTRSGVRLMTEPRPRWEDADLIAALDPGIATRLLAAHQASRRCRPCWTDAPCPTRLLAVAIAERAAAARA